MVEATEKKGWSIVTKLSTLFGMCLSASALIEYLISHFSYIVVTSQTNQQRLLTLTPFVVILSAATAYIVWSKKPELNSLLYGKVQCAIEYLTRLISANIRGVLFVALFSACFFVLEGVLLIIQFLEPWSDSSLGGDVKFVPAGTPNVLFCIYDVRIKDFRKVMNYYNSHPYKSDQPYSSDSDDEPAIATVLSLGAWELFFT